MVTPDQRRAAKSIGIRANQMVWLAGAGYVEYTYPNYQYSVDKWRETLEFHEYPPERIDRIIELLYATTTPAS